MKYPYIPLKMNSKPWMKFNNNINKESQIKIMKTIYPR